MFRWYIIRTLLYKEMLRYRYNWGLLVVVVALLALSGLVALSSRFSRLLPGQGGSEIQRCRIVYAGDRPRAKEWAEHLRTHPPASVTLDFDERAAGTPLRAIVRDGELLIQLSASPAPDPSTPPSEAWKISYWCKDEAAPGTMVVRDWIEMATTDFLGTSPRVKVETLAGTVPAGTEKVEVLSTIVTAFAIFALYLLSFNLFITSTGEERERKILLGLLLSPAAPQEVLAAKAIFYAASSLTVSLAVVGMYRPTLLLQPLLWLTVISGSVAYVAIGTVIVSIVRRQTTINTISMLYLVVTTIIMILSQILPPFIVLKALLVENYLYAQMKQLVAGQYQNWMVWSQLALLVGAGAWCALAVWIFGRQATAIAQVR
jgi:hypothetical protein